MYFNSFHEIFGPVNKINELKTAEDQRVEEPVLVRVRRDGDLQDESMRGAKIDAMDGKVLARAKRFKRDATLENMGGKKISSRQKRSEASDPNYVKLMKLVTEKVLEGRRKRPVEGRKKRSVNVEVSEERLTRRVMRHVNKALNALENIAIKKRQAARK